MNSSKNDNSFCKYLPSNRRTTKGKRKKVPQPKIQETKSFVQNSQPFLVSSTPKKNSFSSKKKGSNSSFDDSGRGSYFQCPDGIISSSKKLKEEKLNAKDYNIFHIDSKIKEKLSSKISTIPELEKDLKRMLWILSNGDDPTQRIVAKQEASVIRKRIQDLESTLELTLYIFRTSDLVEEYRNLMQKSGAKNFVKIQSKEQRLNDDRMKEIADQFLCIAQNYIEIENLPRVPKKMVCSSCNGTDFTLSKDDDSIYICETCNTEQEILDDSPSFKDTDRVNMSSKYTYSRKGHFIDAKKRFQGTQNTDPKKIQEAARVIREQMVQHNLVAEQNLPNSVSKDHVYLFLSEQDLSSHYEDLNLLFFIVTGVPCPDISEYEEELDELFDKQEWGLDQIMEDNRVNSLNVNYKLYKLLQKLGYPCRKDDFHILKTPTKEDEHDEKMKACWSLPELNWKWIPTT